MATPIDIIGGFYTVDGRSWAAQDCVNYLPMAAEVSGTKTRTSLKTPPGLRPYVEIGDGPAFAIRGGHDVEGRRFVVSGQRLYQISNTGVAIPLGTVPGVGRVSMAHNQIAGGNELLVVNGNAGYVWNTVKQTFTRITDQGYPGAFLADFVDSYLMQVEPFGRYLFHSDLANATEYNTLDRFEAEAQPDRIVSMLVDHGEVWAFGDRTVELFQNTGAAQGTFQPKGITIEQGCAGRFTPAKLDNSVFWLGNDGIFYRADGYSPVRISTHAIEDAIADSDWSQAFAFTWSSKGHKVYYCTFPDGQTWGYDVSSRLWHRRASYHPVHEVARRWRLSDLFYSNGEWIGCDSMSGKLFILDWDYMFEGEGEPLVSERVTQISYSAGRRFSVDALELEVLTGQIATAPTEFPIQPEGPTISGDAPDAIEGELYTFTYTTTAGDTPIVRVVISSGALPDGLSMSTTGAITGTPTTYGKESFTVRVIDENGLWDELTDSIEVAPVWIATGTGVPVNSYAFATSNGRDWDHPVRPADSGGFKSYRLAITTGQRILLFTASGAAGSFSNDRGQTFEEISGLSEQTASAVAYDGEAFVVARNSFIIDVSNDGETFAAVTVGNTNPDDGTGSFVSAAATDSRIVCCSSRSTVSLDHAVTFSPLGSNYVFPGAAGPTSGPIARAIATDGEKFVAVGDGNNISWSSNGTTWADLESPFEGTADLTAIGYSQGTWVVCNQDGRIAYGDVFGAMIISPFEFGAGIKAVNTSLGTTVVGGELGKIAYSQNLVDWTFAETQLGTGITFSSIAVPREVAL